jgi:hypothetical protein
LNPQEGFPSPDFLTTTAFAAIAVCGLDFPFTVGFPLGAACQISTPSDFSAWLGIAILQVSPNLSGSTPRVSPRALKLESKSDTFAYFVTRPLFLPLYVGVKA